MTATILSKRISLVHLVWVPLGPAPFIRFLDAHIVNPPGMDFRLTIVYSGFKAEDQLTSYRIALRERSISSDEILLPGPGWDIRSYRIAASMLSDDYICFLNSWSQPLVSNWLESLLSPQLTSREYRLTGSSGNLVSAFWCLPSERTQGFSRIPLKGWLQRRRFRRLVDLQLNNFPPQLGPMIRTNAFALRRTDFLAMKVPPFYKKLDTYKFESGWLSMTRQILGEGYRVAVAGRGKVAFDPPDWPGSGTYASSEQEALLVSDNRTDIYAAGDAQQRAMLHRQAYHWPPIENYEPYPGCLKRLEAETAKK